MAVVEGSMKSLVIAAFFGLGIGAPAADPPLTAPPVSAPPVSAPPVSDWAPDESIVVSAKAAGPAFWHIKKGDSEIYILGTVGDIPKDLAWNSAHASDVIKGARVVLTPAQASAGFFSTTWFLLWNRSLLSMPDGKKLLDTLPPDLRTRFIKVVKDLHGPAMNTFADDPPIIAAVKLENGFTTTAKLTAEEPIAAMAKIARQNHVPVARVAEYDGLGLVKEILRLPQEAQQACLKEAVTDVEQRMVHARPAAEAWVTGDIKVVKAHYTPRVFWHCAQATASFGKLYDRAVADYLKAINEALSKPGKTVLITDIGPLLRNTGVVEKLHAEGLTIEGPAE
jgi:uncharacterized protein YbaP (TraB family)